MKSPNKQRHDARETVTQLLRMLDSATTEALELFNQWARRQPYRLDPEDQLAEERLAQQRAFREHLRYLKRRHFIKTKKTEAGLLCELTDEGRGEVLKRLVMERPRLPRDQVCLVLYDVPTFGNLGRDALRYFLKRIGFKQVQKSVWQTDKDVVNEVLEFVRTSKIHDWVQVYLARRQK